MGYLGSEFQEVHICPSIDQFTFEIICALVGYKHNPYTDRCKLPSF